MTAVEVHSLNDERRLEEEIQHSAVEAAGRLRGLSDSTDPLAILEAMKFERIGAHPLSRSRRLNLIEQVNQTFTYLVTLRAAEFLFDTHPETSGFRLNLGTAAGSDIESFDQMIAAEVFAAVSPDNNQ